jgi:hypothetical protein
MLATQRSPDVTDEEVNTLRQWVTELAVFPPAKQPASNKLGKLLRFGKFVVEGTPPSIANSYSVPMQQWLDSRVSAGICDAITCEHSSNEQYIRSHWRDRIQTLVNIHSSLYGTCKQQLEHGTSTSPRRDSVYLPLLHRYEKRYCQKFSRIVVTTNDDREQIEAFSPAAKIAVIPNGVDLQAFPYREQDPGGYRLVFTGAMDALANIDAARFFAAEVFPHIRKQYPQAEFYIVGARPQPEILQLQEQPGVTVTGRVDAMSEMLHQATVCAIPMRSGFGIKNKTLEAMAAGVPVVGSDRGLEGLQVDAPTQRALRANRPQEYISAIARLFDSPQLRTELSQNGRQYIVSEFSWERACQEYEAFLCDSEGANNLP